MNLIKKLKLVILALMAGLFFTACSDDDSDGEPADVSAPTYGSNTGVTGIGMSGDSYLVSAGGAFDVNVDVQDNRGLSQLRINIHDGGDGHSHKIASEKFTFDSIIDLGGAKTKTMSFSVAVPSDVLAGPYHFGMFLTDIAGNQAEAMYYELDITNAYQPTVNVSSISVHGSTYQAASFPDEADAEKGDTVEMAGSIDIPAVSNYDLDEVEVKLVKMGHDHDDHDGHMHGGKIAHGDEEVAEVKIESFTDPKSFDLADLTGASALVIPADLDGDHADLKIIFKVKDSHGNIKMMHLEEPKLHVH